MASVLIIGGADQGKRFILTGPLVTVGRGADSQLQLVDTEVSRHHAQFRQENGNFKLVDLQSSNGTFVNGRRIQEAVLRSGDQIQVGRTLMIFRGDSAIIPTPPELAEQVTVTSLEAAEPDSSEIVKAVDHEQGSRLLTEPQRADSAWLKDALARLAVLYQTTHVISQVTEVDVLLEKILDLIFTVIEADRGFIMLKNEETGELETKAVRFRHGRQANEQISVSRTIVNYVLQRREGVLTSNAMRDRRFDAGESIVQHGIRSALCVPMLGRHDLVGVIHVDTRVPAADLLQEEADGRILTEDHLKLLIAIAHQAAMAVENTRFYLALVRTERLAAVGETIATLSHHIKNILQGMRSGSYLIDMGLKNGDNAMVRRGWHVVEKNQTRIYNLVMDMLSYSKDRQPAFELTDPNEVVADVIELMLPRAKEVGVHLKAQLRRSVPKILMDPEGIHRAVLNLVTNAIDATERNKGRVVVLTHANPAAQQVWIDVLDTGTGIAEEDLPNLFNLFSSTKGERGTGLGLAVARKIAREHGGDIRVTSRPGAGSKFSLILPLRTAVEETTGQPTTDTAVPTPPPAK